MKQMWAAIDVGLSTGIVIGYRIDGGIPEIIASRTVDLRTRDVQATFAEIRRLFQDFKVRGIVVEYPFDSQISLMGIETKIVKRQWMEFIGSFQNVTVIDIPPSRWKTTPSGSLNVFDQQHLNEAWKKHAPTQHERDAASILHWVSNFYRNQ